MLWGDYYALVYNNNSNKEMHANKGDVKCKNKVNNIKKVIQ